MRSRRSGWMPHMLACVWFLLHQPSAQEGSIRKKKKKSSSGKWSSSKGSDLRILYCRLKWTPDWRNVLFATQTNLPQHSWATFVTHDELPLSLFLLLYLTLDSSVLVPCYHTFKDVKIVIAYWDNIAAFKTSQIVPKDFLHQCLSNLVTEGAQWGTTVADCSLFIIFWLHKSLQWVMAMKK